MSGTMRRCVIVSVGAVAGVLLLGGCPWQPPAGGTSDGKAALKPFASADELLRYFREQVRTQRGRATNVFRDVWELLPVGAAAPGADNAADEQSGGSTSYTTTNIQEEGVDESDILKSDGTNFYIVKGKTLRIVRAVPMGEMQQLANVEFDDYIDSIYLLGSKVVVLCRKGGWAGGPRPLGNPDIAWVGMMWPPYYENAATVVSEVDVSDPAAAAITKQVEFDGSLVSSRVTGGRLILVLTILPTVPENVNTFTVGLITLDQVLPNMRGGADGETPMVPPERWYRPETPDGYCTTAVMTLDANDIEVVVGSVAVLANAGTIYASTEAIYLTDTEYTVDNDYRETTAVHKLAFNADGVAEYVASGSVPGRLLNQFSLGEYEGYLRLATHVSNFGGWVFAEGADVAVTNAEPRAQDRDETPVDDGSNGEGDGDEPDQGDQTVTQASPPPDSPYNAVYVLHDAEGVMEIVGAIEGIAPNENLYAARFMGPRGFLVTFEQIDPLFVLDLSEPTDPSIRGELKIPGYSDYLHPFGDNLLIGVGRSTMETPWGGVVAHAVQLSLFDVTEPNNPTLIEQLELGGYGSESDVSNTHKAFAFLPDRGLLAIPAVLLPEQNNPWGDGGYWGGPVFDGVVCFHVDAEGFTELGRVGSVVYDEWGWTQWRRAAFIDDVAYAVTPAGVRAAALDDFAAPQKLVLTPNDDEVGGWGGGNDGGIRDEGDGGGSSPGNAGQTEPSGPTQ